MYLLTIRLLACKTTSCAPINWLRFTPPYFKARSLSVRRSRPSGTRMSMHFMRHDMRCMIWGWFRSNHQEGAVLPLWLLVVRSILYPLDFLRWRLGMKNGYQFESDTWVIGGVRYSTRALLMLAKAEGGVYRITRTGDTVSLEIVTATCRHTGKIQARKFPDGENGVAQ